MLKPFARCHHHFKLRKKVWMYSGELIFIFRCQNCGHDYEIPKDVFWGKRVGWEFYKRGWQ